MKSKERIRIIKGYKQTIPINYFNKAQQLRKDSYVKEGFYKEKDPAEDKYDSHAYHIIALNEEDSVIGCLRIIEEDMPLLCIYSEEISQLKKAFKPRKYA